MTGVTPSVGLLGFFDIASFGDLVIPRIVEGEIRRRCPLASIRVYAPLGRNHPVPLDGGHLAEPLGTPSPERLRGIVGDHDLVLLGWTGDQQDPRELGLYRRTADDAAPSGPADWFTDGPGPEAPDHYPVVRLGDGAGQDAVLLVDRVCPEPRRAMRLRHLQALGRWPGGMPVVIDTDALAPGAPAGATASVLSVLLGQSPSQRLVAVDHQERPEPPPLASHVAEAHGQITFCVPALSLDDIAAAVSAAGIVVAASLQIARVAISFGVPMVLIRPSAPEALDALARRAALEPAVVSDAAAARAAVVRAVSAGHREAVTAARSRLMDNLDACFDRIVELMLSSFERRVAHDGARQLLALATRLHAEAASLRVAHEARGLQLAEAKARLIEATDSGPSEVAEDGP